MYGCEKDRTNFAILNFSATVDLLEKRKKFFIRKIERDRKIQITGFVIDRVVSHALN